MDFQLWIKKPQKEINIIKMVRVRYDKESKKWLHLTEDDPVSDMDITMDGLRLKYLDQVKKDLKNDLDHPEIVSGSVGSGKSTIGRLDCRYVSDERFHPRTHLVKDVKDIKRVFRNAKKGDGVLIDEGSGIFSATDTMTKKTKYANYILDVCRQKNLLIVIVAPFFHRLTSAVAIDRSITLTRVYIDNRTGLRGRFAFYGTKRKEKLYRFAKANHGSLRGIKPKYRGRFSKDKTFTEEYRKVKDETLDLALDSLNPDKPKPLNQHEIIVQYRIDLLKSNMDKPIKEMAQMLGVTTRTIDHYRQKAKEQISLENQELINTKSTKSPNYEGGG